MVLSSFDESSKWVIVWFEFKNKCKKNESINLICKMIFLYFSIKIKTIWI